ATMAGIYADEGSSSVVVTGSTIYEIGNHAASGSYSPNGVQYGWGVIFASGVTGSINHNVISQYQKGGIVLLGSDDVSVEHNTVTGSGPISYIAQNGIEVDDGATATVSHNTVTANMYIPTTYAATGILLYDAGSSVVSHNSVSSNGYGIYVFNDGSVTATYGVSHNNVQSDTYAGILIYGAAATVDHNKVSMNEYSNSYWGGNYGPLGTYYETYGSTSNPSSYYYSSGIYLWDAGGTTVDHNILEYNDVGIWVYDDQILESSYSISHNVIGNTNYYGIVFDGASGTSDHNVILNSPVGLMATTEISLSNTVTSTHDVFIGVSTTTLVLQDPSNPGYTAEIIS
ncbi:MAG: right-handed parallel beta-helix repeat-containing protein, partial [Thermoplasmatales archaeon]